MEIKMSNANIVITQHSGDFACEPKTYSWTVSEPGLYADESVGMPFGVGKHSIAAALLDAANAAIGLDYKTANVSYLPKGHGIKTASIQLAKFGINEARSAADSLMSE